MTEPNDFGAFRSGELCILFECHAIVCALPTRHVDRLVLPEEANLVTAPAGSSGKTLDGKRVLESAGQHYVAWDLGELLELPSLSASWLLLRLSHRGAFIPVALRAGRCRAVQRKDALAKLPRGVFRRRQSAFPASFPVTTADGARAVVGVCLDPVALFSAAELDRARGTLELHGAGQESS